MNDGQGALQKPDLWEQQSVRWANVGAPTRPTVEDGEILLNRVKAIAAGLEGVAGLEPKVVVFGVTPEVIQLAWPSGTVLKAFDLSADMIRMHWRENPVIPSTVTQSNWKQLPLESSSIDFIVGDGCLSALTDIQEAHAVFKEASRVLNRGGRIVMRCFVRPDHQELTDDVIADALNGQIEYFGTLKWRLAMSLVDEASSLVSPSRVHQVFCQKFPDRAFLASRTGWKLETIETIDSYESMTSNIVFPSKADLESLCADLFKIESIEFGGYELSERCPTIVFGKA